MYVHAKFAGDISIDRCRSLFRVDFRTLPYLGVHQTRAEGKGTFDQPFGLPKTYLRSHIASKLRHVRIRVHLQAVLLYKRYLRRRRHLSPSSIFLLCLAMESLSRVLSIRPRVSAWIPFSAARGNRAKAHSFSPQSSASFRGATKVQAAVMSGNARHVGR